VDYSTRTATNSTTGFTTQQAGTDSNGTYYDFGDGSYQYAFGTVLPSNFDTTATHTLGIYATRDLREFELSFYVDNETRSFVPNGSAVTRIRDVVPTEACNQCHDPLSAHGETGRRDVEICILCHTPQTIDPDSMNTVDMKVMVHKIHRGENLPSVQAGHPYQIIGRGGVSDFSTVVFPQDIRNCATCHQAPAQQVNNWLLNPTADACGSCHDDVNFKTGANHPGGPQSNDRDCARCHWPQGVEEYDASIAGAHTVPYKSTQLRYPKVEILSITNTAPGQKPTVTFKITDKDGAPMAPSDMGGTKGRLALTLAGPTSDYRWYLQEAADKAQYANGVATYTFAGSIPSEAKGSYALESEGRLVTTLNPGTTIESTYQEPAGNAIKYFAVTGTTVTPRRTVVDQAKCNKCHDKLILHGSNRTEIAACVICHNPANTDVARRPASAGAAETIDMKIMIHKIHTGEELEGDYTIYGFGNTPNNFNEVRFPGDRRDCLACHVGPPSMPASYTVPLPSTVTPSTTPRDLWNPTLPTSAACLGCHDSVAAAAHAFINTAAIGGTSFESCSVCHKESADFAVSQVHAR
jgi:OmcA/MtrC family decaheme c-type cytochrome